MTTPNEPTPPELEDSTELEDDSPLDRAAARKLRSEARNLRARLKASEEARAAEAEQYGGAAAVVSAMQLAEVKRIAGEHLIDADDLLTHQPDMTAYFDDEFAGMVNADKVSEQAKALIAARPHLGKPAAVTAPPTDRPIEGLRAGASPPETVSTPTWADAIRGTGR